ncbi:hypothetical protein ANANG_G00209510 [Anguilla anguilla]|uniref:Protein phosphatase 1 regulatory subunit n=1 Tax=Anguilla anguilla TaxID=7936 RepID=A0A9D3LZI1_ANGAN|nr:hypothetical protein ANANG_G00209510 [Anguilla anguilla]
MAADDRSRSEAARQRRHDQLQRWMGSETDRTVPEIRERPASNEGRRARVRFTQGAVFMAACSAGDREEVAALLRQGADINHANIDGLTALHQACIDENAEMVQFLVESGSDVNRGDNEGWTPLHAAASCGFLQITKYLIEHGARVGVVNSEGELPLDVATEDAMSRLLKEEIKKQAVDVDSARREEERVMLQDAMAVLGGRATLTPHPNTGATALHVAVAKGYIQVMKVLLQCGLDVDSRDCDGWTPLHAAAHWGQEEACSLLADNMCDMGAVNKVGQTPLDVADENLVDSLEELMKKQKALRTEKQKQSPIIEINPPVTVAPVRTRRTSISRMSSKEKISLHERERHAPRPAEQPCRGGRGGTDGPPGATRGLPQLELRGGERIGERRRVRKNENARNHQQPEQQAQQLRPLPAPRQPAQQELWSDPGRPPAPEGPESSRMSLRKAGSFGALSTTGALAPGSEPAKGPESAAGMMRSASSPRLSLESDPKEPRLARVPPTPTRRLFTIADLNNPDLSSSGLTRSSSYTRRLNSQTGSDLTSQAPSMTRSSSYGRKLDEPAVTSVTTGPTSALSRLNSLTSQRLAQDQLEKKEPESSTTSNSVTTATSELESKQRRKSYLTPVRDEEAEAQRRARSRHARQSRRSTQGVTLTDLQEAEKMKTEQKEREKKKEDEDRDGRQRKGDEGEVSWRSRIANLQKSDLLGLTSPPGAPRAPAAEGRGTEPADGEDRERRRLRTRRRGAHRTEESDDNEPSGEDEGVAGGQANRYTSRSDVSCNDRIIGRGSETKDYKKLFEEVSRENGQLQAQLQDTMRTVSQTRMDLDKATQRQERFSDCSALLELEKKERRILERRVAELEEELKVLGDLRADNQRLKDENGALIRVISKLSK